MIERWDPFREMRALRDSFNRFFDEALLRPSSDWLAGFRDQPAMNVYETDAGITVEVHLPGIKREEIDVTLSGNTLTIKGERRAARRLKRSTICAARCTMVPSCAGLRSPSMSIWRSRRPRSRMAC